MLFKDISSSTIIMIEQFKNLPIEIVNKIMLYLSHDIATVLKKSSIEYRRIHDYYFDTHYVSYKTFLCRYGHSHFINDVKKKKLKKIKNKNV
jgi:hypothetical protein